LAGSIGDHGAICPRLLIGRGQFTSKYEAVILQGHFVEQAAVAGEHDAIGNHAAQKGEKDRPSDEEQHEGGADEGQQGSDPEYDYDVRISCENSYEGFYIYR